MWGYPTANSESPSIGVIPVPSMPTPTASPIPVTGRGPIAASFGETAPSDKPRPKVHTDKFRRCVSEVTAKGGDQQKAYAICQASIGAGAILEPHQRKSAGDYVRTDRHKG